jgi:hypothetical protein
MAAARDPRAAAVRHFVTLNKEQRNIRSSSVTPLPGSSGEADNQEERGSQDISVTGVPPVNRAAPHRV